MSKEKNENIKFTSGFVYYCFGSGKKREKCEPKKAVKVWKKSKFKLYTAQRSLFLPFLAVNFFTGILCSFRCSCYYYYYFCFYIILQIYYFYGKVYICVAFNSILFSSHFLLIFFRLLLVSVVLLLALLLLSYFFTFLFAFQIFLTLFFV